MGGKAGTNYRLPRGRVAAVAEPLGSTQQKGHATEGQAHHGDDEGEPAGVGVGPLPADAAEDGLGEQRGDQADSDGAGSPAKKLRGAVIGRGLRRSFTSGRIGGSG
jgi:hypothetical protein